MLVAFVDPSQVSATGPCPLLPADAAMTSYWDAALGNVTDVLKKKGMWDNLLLVLTTE